MATCSKKSRTSDFLFQCLSLGSPLARVAAFTAGISALVLLDVTSSGLPCIWEKLFGYCPANGTTRALNAFFHGKWEEAVRYNLNVVAVIPIIIGMLVTDILRFIKTKGNKGHSPVEIR